MPIYLCTLTDVQNRLSTVGVTLRVDDDASTIGQCLSRATNKVYYYTEPLYDALEIQEDATSFGWVNDRAVDIACYYVCTRRANPCPASVMQDYKDALTQLEDIRVDQTQIPNVWQRHRSSPTFSNVKIDTSYVTAKIRVDRPTSSSDPTLGYSIYSNWETVGLIEY